MGKWTCKCGQAMNNHRAPDPNAYSVYSDEFLVEIMNKKMVMIQFLMKTFQRPHFICGSALSVAVSWFLAKTGMEITLLL